MSVARVQEPVHTRKQGLRYHSREARTANTISGSDEFGHLIRDEMGLVRIVDSIHYNPAKHGLVTDRRTGLGRPFIGNSDKGYRPSIVR